MPYHLPALNAHPLQQSKSPAQSEEIAMTDMGDARNSSLPQFQAHPSEVEVSQLLQKAAEQYEECMRLADLADVSDPSEDFQPRYAWDNPIGFVVADGQNAELV